MTVSRDDELFAKTMLDALGVEGMLHALRVLARHGSKRYRAAAAKLLDELDAGVARRREQLKKPGGKTAP